MSVQVVQGAADGSFKRHTLRVQQFLTQMDLAYDHGITYSVLLQEDGEIVATGSLEANVLKCIAVSPTHQGMGHMATVVTALYGELVRQGIRHCFVFTKPKNQAMFQDLGFYPIVTTQDVLLLENQKNGMALYLQGLKEETLIGDYGKIGAIVANCNPFTNGHRYLIEQASHDCDLLHLFILSQGEGMFTAQERYAMVQAGVADLPNVCLHQTGDYLISHATFPTYFIKEQAHQANCLLDLTLFHQYIAKALHIQVRYVGQEPFCAVTNNYNRTMEQYFADKDIAFVELPRKTVDETPISATFVREHIGQWDAIAPCVPVTTLSYLKQKFSYHL